LLSRINSGRKPRKRRLRGVSRTKMFEPKDLLAPTVTLLAVLFAVFAFLFPRAIELYRTRMAKLSEIDIPDHVRKNCGFRVGILGDSFLLFVISFALLIAALIYCPITLSRVADYYLGTQYVGFERIDIYSFLRDFKQMTIFLTVVFSFVPGAVLCLLVEDMFFSKRLPTLVRFYIKNVLERRPSKEEADSLLPEARRLYESKAFGESVLYSMASLELALKNKFGLPVNVGFGRLLGSVIERLGGVISAEELIKIRRVRNIAAHPSPESRVTRQDAEQVLHLVEDILQRLEMNLPEGGN